MGRKILFITTDQQRYDTLGCNGGTLSRTPVVDGLAAAGVRATGARLVEHMRHDKKASGGRLPFLLVRGIGRTYLDRDVDLGAVEAFLDAQPR